MKIEITMDDLLKDMKEYTDAFTYLNFFHSLARKTNPVMSSMIDQEYLTEFGCNIPSLTLNDMKGEQ